MLCPTQTPFTQPEELNQGLEVTPTRRNLEQVNVVTTSELGQGSATLDLALPHRLAKTRVGRIDHIVQSRLGILQLDEPNRRQLFLAGVRDDDGNDIVPMAGPFEGLVHAVVEKIAQQEQQYTPPGDAVEKIQSCPEVGAWPLGLEDKQVADDAQGVSRSLAWRHKFLDVIGADQQANFVVIARCAEG